MITGHRTSRLTAADPALTLEERSILAALANGQDYRDVAAWLGCSQRALCTRMWRLRVLFEADSTVELVARFVRSTL